MFGTLTTEELTTLYRMVKSGRDRTYLLNIRSEYDHHGVITDASDVMRDLHAVNQAR